MVFFYLARLLIGCVAVSRNASKVDTLPQGYNLDNYASAPINVSNYIPAEPVELFPDLWKGEHIPSSLMFYFTPASLVVC